MTKPEPLPQIVNVNHDRSASSEFDLVGYKLLGPEPFGEALAEFEVPEDDLHNWTIYNRHPGGNFVPDIKTIILNHGLITAAMDKKAARRMKHGSLENPQRGYYDAFKPTAERIILAQLAGGAAVSLSAEHTPSWRQKNREVEATIAAFIAMG